MVLGIDASRAEKGQHTGVEWYSINIIKALIPLVPVSWDVVLYSRGGDLSALGKLPGNWRVQVIRAPLNRAWTIVALSLYLLRHKPDIFFEPSHIMPFFAPKKSITMVHDTAWRNYPKAYSWQGKIILELSLSRAKCAAQVLVPTDFVKQEILKLGFKNDQVITVPHGLDHERYHPYAKEDIESVLKKYNLTRPFVLCVGRIEEKKNTSRLLDAWERGGFASNYDLVLVGKAGFGGSFIIEAAKEVSGVRILGWVSEEDLPRLYAGARALAFPSLYEGFGFPALQGAATGVPVMAAKIGALTEIMEEAAFWVDPLYVSSITQGLVTIVSDEETRAALTVAGVIQAKKYTWEHSGALTWEALHRLL